MKDHDNEEWKWKGKSSDFNEFAKNGRNNAAFNLKKSEIQCK